MKYVVGFLFITKENSRVRSVLLQLQDVRKKYVGGMWNGMGGKVEIGETPNGAMRREAWEEARVILPEGERWQQFHYERHPSGNELYFYVAQVNTPFQWEMGPNGEELGLWPSGIPSVMVTQGKAVPNLDYLIPMAEHWLDHPTEHYLEG